MIIQTITLPETNIAHENPIFPGKYHQNGGFSMAMLVSGSVQHLKNPVPLVTPPGLEDRSRPQNLKRLATSEVLEHFLPRRFFVASYTPENERMSPRKGLFQ